MPLFLAAMALFGGLAVWESAAQPRTFSDRENRPLATFPPFSVQSVRSGRWMKGVEDAAGDQFPLRDAWVDVQAVEDALMLRNARNGILIGKEGWLFEGAAGLDVDTAHRNIVALNKLAAHTGLPVTLMLVPLSSAVYPQFLPAGYRADDQAALLASLYGEAGAQSVDLLSALRAQSGAEALFFRTDHHWSLAGAQVGEAALLAAWGLPPAPEAPAQTLPGGQYGSYFARAPSPFIAPDDFALTAPSGVRLRTDETARPALYNAGEMTAVRDKYAKLLYGNHGLITLDSDAPGGTLLVIKDSYANMLLPLLARSFGHIEAVDLRYYTGDLLQWMQRPGARLLCLYGLNTWLSDRNLPRAVARWKD
jgi:hypothetical protein